MSVIRYLLDEHIDPAYRSGLLRIEPAISIRCIGDPGVPPRGAADPDVLSWCERYDTLLVTNNRRSMPRHLSAHVSAGRGLPGILVINPDAGIRRMLDTLWLIWATGESEIYRDQITFL